MDILKNFSVLSPGAKLVVQGANGVAPYTYSVDSGGSGGQINSDGIYTAPLGIAWGQDTITVTDDNGDSVSTVIYISTPIQLVADIIQKGLGLDADQCYIYNQKITLPKDERVYVAVKTQSLKPFAVKEVIDPDTNEEVISQSVQETVAIDIHSRGMDAYQAKNKVIPLLRGRYSKDLQYANSFRIAKLPNNFNDISEAWESEIPYRFNITINILYSQTFREAVDYYDDFSASLITSTGKEEDIDV